MIPHPVISILRKGATPFGKQTKTRLWRAGPCFAFRPRLALGRIAGEALLTAFDFRGHATEHGVQVGTDGEHDASDGDGDAGCDQAVLDCSCTLFGFEELLEHITLRLFCDEQLTLAYNSIITPQWLKPGK
jgi:hypothetical protein